MGIAPGLPQVPTAPPRDWLSRNWKWVVPVGFFSIVLVIAVFVGCIFLILETSFQHSDWLREASTFPDRLGMRTFRFPSVDRRERARSML